MTNLFQQIIIHKIAKPMLLSSTFINTVDIINKKQYSLLIQQLYLQFQPTFLEIYFQCFFRNFKLSYNKQNTPIKKMFSGNTYEDQGTGKKITGLQARRGQNFSLAWDTPNQLNYYQQRKTKDITNKITASMNNPPAKNYLKRASQNYEHQYLQRQQQRLFQDQYGDLNYGNQYPRSSQPESRQNQPIYDHRYNNKNFRPNDYPAPVGYNQHFSPNKQEIDRALFQYQSVHKQSQSSSDRRNLINEQQRRIASKPKENMRDLIFNNVGINDPYSLRGNSRRAYTNIILGHN